MGKVNFKMEDYIKPPEGSLFNPVTGPRGLRLAIVFGNEAVGGKCPFHAVQCNHCDIGEGEGLQFTSEMNLKRLEFFKQYYADVWGKINHLVIYNYGSTMNEVEFSTRTIDGILDFVSSQPSIRRISFDSREQFITRQRINPFIQKLRDDQTFAITIGLESQDDTVRLVNLNKKITRDQVDNVFGVLEEFLPKTSVDINVLFQPPGISGKEAVADSVATINYGLELMKKHHVTVDFNFHPYYPSEKGTFAFPDHPRAFMEDAVKALILIIRRMKEVGGDCKIFVGWNDEGHDLQQGVRSKKLMLYDPAFSAFNQSQAEKDLII